MGVYQRQLGRTRLGTSYIKDSEAVFGSVDSDSSAAADALPSRRTCIIVCGMHRTGTSAVARVVSLLGADLPKDLISPNANNVRGYWEPTAVVRVHNQLLEALGTSSADPLPLPRDWLELSCTQQAKAELAGILESDFSESSLFVVKDPRIAKVLPLWLELLDELHVDTRVVIPFRHPLDVAASLKARDSMSLATSLLLYADSYLNAELSSRGRRRCFVSYDQLLSDWRHLQRKLTDLLGKGFPEESPERSFEIERYLSSDLRHHQHNRDDLRRLTNAQPIVAELYDLLKESALSDDSIRLQKSFDRLRRLFDDAASLYRPYMIDERSRWQEAVNQYEHSKSWKATAPLRWMNRIFNL
jgi:hypothetical protein